MYCVSSVRKFGQLLKVGGAPHTHPSVLLLVHHELSSKLMMGLRKPGYRGLIRREHSIVSEPDTLHHAGGEGERARTAGDNDEPTLTCLILGLERDDGGRRSWSWCSPCFVLLLADRPRERKQTKNGPHTNNLVFVRNASFGR